MLFLSYLFLQETDIFFALLLSSASDKCLQESTCLSFSDHIVATTELWEMHLNETSGSHRHPTVLFTTEAKDMMQEQQNWVKENEQAKLPFHFDFVTNAKDLLPDSGWAKDSSVFTSFCCSCVVMKLFYPSNTLVLPFSVRL